MWLCLDRIFRRFRLKKMNWNSQSRQSRTTLIVYLTSIFRWLKTDMPPFWYTLAFPNSKKSCSEYLHNIPNSISSTISRILDILLKIVCTELSELFWHLSRYWCYFRNWEPCLKFLGQRFAFSLDKCTKFLMWHSVRLGAFDIHRCAWG